mmetsp:Transcript_52301/g.124783  ORF Transcript_52301/g.124783 Transcript_52301/m.124783 type:complete len:229 (+) Transcript_52301:108-794(+)
MAKKAGLVFLHGSGDSGEGIEMWLTQASSGKFNTFLAEGGVVAVYPNAPVVPYSLMGGQPLAVWFDRIGMKYEAPEDQAGITRSVSQVDAEIDRLVALGIPENRIAVAGFSMGGCLALHVGYGAGKYSGKLGAVACMSSFLPEDSLLDKGIAKSESLPPLFMAHGAADPMIRLEWAKSTRGRLEAAGVPVPTEVLVFQGLMHSMCESELDQLGEFLAKHLLSREGGGK